MGRPLNKKFFGDTANPGRQLAVRTQFTAGVTVIAWIVEQKGTNKYIVTDGTDIGTVVLGDVTDLGPGVGVMRGATLGGPAFVKQINANDVRGFDGVTFSWSFDAPVSAKDIFLQSA